MTPPVPNESKGYLTDRRWDPTPINNRSECNRPGRGIDPGRRLRRLYRGWPAEPFCESFGHHFSGAGLWRSGHWRSQSGAREGMAWLGCPAGAHGVHKLPRPIPDLLLDFLWLWLRPWAVRPPTPKPICGATSKSAHLRFTRWSSPSNEPVLSVNPASLEASRSSFLQKKSQSLNGSKSIRQILCDEVLVALLPSLARSGSLVLSCVGGSLRCRGALRKGGSLSRDAAELA